MAARRPSRPRRANSSLEKTLSLDLQLVNGSWTGATTRARTAWCSPSTNRMCRSIWRKGRSAVGPRGEIVKELTLPELWNARYDPPASLTRAMIVAELNSRLVRIVSLLFLPLLAVPLGIVSRRARRSIGVVVGLVMLYSFSQCAAIRREHGRDRRAAADHRAVAAGRDLCRHRRLGLPHDEQAARLQPGQRDAGSDERLSTPSAVIRQEQRARMMSTVGNYASRSLLMHLAMTLSGFVAFLLLLDLMNRGDDVVLRHGKSALALAKYAALRLPDLASFILPLRRADRVPADAGEIRAQQRDHGAEGERLVVLSLC